MANPDRGEVRLDVDGTGYKLKLTLTAIAELQKKKGKPFGRLMDAVGELDVDAIGGLLWAALQMHHPREFKTEEQVLALIDTDGGLSTLRKYVDLLNELFALNTPKDGAEANPPTAQSGGTVASSISELEPTPV